VLYAEHNQFYVVDPSALGEADGNGAFDNASLEDRVAVGSGSLTVFTATYGYVRVILERLEERPGDDLREYDHVVEAPFHAASGRVSALEVTEAKAELTIPQGDYVARIAWSGVEGADQRDPEADDELETLHLQLWPGRLDERRVVKWHPDWEPAEERPANPYGLRVLVGRECDGMKGLRVVGEPKDAGEDDDHSLVLAADGTHWLHYYSRVPPYSEVLLELPESALAEYDPVDY
jgi:hypothetical protein